MNAWDCAVARSESLPYTPIRFLRSPSKPRPRNRYFLQIRPISQLPHTPVTTPQEGFGDPGGDPMVVAQSSCCEPP